MDRQNWVLTYCLPVSPFPTCTLYTRTSKQISAQVVAYLYRPAIHAELSIHLWARTVSKSTWSQNLCRAVETSARGELDTGAPCHQVTPLHTACRPLATLLCRASADRCAQLCHMRHGRRCCEWRRQACHPPPVHHILVHWYTSRWKRSCASLRSTSRSTASAHGPVGCMHAHARSHWRARY